MAKYNLDADEEIDIFTINWIEYEVWDIPMRIIENILEIKTWFFKKDIVEQWKPICQDILEIRNKDVDISNLTKDKIFAFITYTKWKIEKGQLW